MGKKKEKKAFISPEQVKRAAKRREEENLKFRTFLKEYADPDVLDRQFLRLHRQIFPQYNCSRCRNCCKLLHATIPACEIDRDAACLNMSRAEFIAEYLERDEFGEWTEKHLPCGFLGEGGACRLGENRPVSCKEFPYTDQPERLSSLYSVLNAVSVCPAAFEIFEALKKEYGFDPRRKGQRCADLRPETDSDFSFIAGYTPWGFPYGVEREDDEAEDLSSEELPF